MNHYHSQEHHVDRIQFPIPGKLKIYIDCEQLTSKLGSVVTLLNVERGSGHGTRNVKATFNVSCVNSGQVTLPSLSRDGSVPSRAGTTWGNRVFYFYFILYLRYFYCGHFIYY